MAGRLGIDFGTSNTVLAVWDETLRDATPLHIPDYGSLLKQGDETISLIPSLVHYADERRRWIGAQVLERNLYQAAHTFRWMKRYIANRSPLKVRVDGKQISPFDAGRDFLTSVLLFAVEELSIEDEEVALTVPVESFEHYEDWLTGIAESVGLRRFRLIDEPSAAALGYGAHIQPGDIYLIFDFGGGTLDISVILIDDAPESAVGRRCRVLGKAGVELGGMTLDQWIFQEVLQRNGCSDFDEDVRQISNALLVECERAKETLSFQPQADISVLNPYTGAPLTATLTRADFEALLDAHDAFAMIDRAVRRALNAARERGYDADAIKAVLLVGGSSQIPAVQQMLYRIFGRERVMLNRPMDAVARGAAAFVAGVDFYDHIQHDYAVRFVNREKGGYDYRAIVSHGTPYPTTEPVAKLRVKASHAAQTHLGLAIFEVSEQRRSREAGGPLELIFDPSGAARVVATTPADEDRRTYFWMNEHHPTFLLADPPGQPGEARFEVAFSIDANKRLLMTARDLQTDTLVYRDYPVVKLT